MNGLQFIRTRCNISAIALAEHLGVTRQMISAWENGRKSIPESRKKELSDYFGVEEKYLDEISEEDMDKLIHSAMYRYSAENGRERFKFGSDGSGDPVYVDDDHFESIDQKRKKLKKKERWLVEELKGYVDGRHCSSIMEEIQQVDRGIKILEYAIHLLKAIGDKKNHQSQITEYEISDVLDALMIYLGFDTEENVEGRIYSKDGTLRIDSSGVHDLVKDLRRIHEQYEKRYQADYSGQRKEHLIFTFGIRDIRSIEEKFSDEYIVARADSCFADIIAINCDAVFADPSAITDEEFRQMNEVFQYGSPIVIFSQKPWYRLNFKYYLVDLSAEFDMEWLDKIRMKHIQSEKI